MSRKAENISIVFIGAGNLATQMALAFLKQEGIDITQIYSRTEKSAKELADKCKCAYTNDILDIRNDADYYIYAVKDDALGELIDNISIDTGIHAHTAGSVPMRIFEKKRTNHGVFYPLQTFSKNKSVRFDNIPIFMEANSDEALRNLTHLAQKISSKVTTCNSTQRQAIHLAAVFCCNFTNHLFNIADNILKSNELPFEYLLPLIQETVDKLQTLSPTDAQTGPAVRYDKNVISKHLKALENMPNEQTIYELLSKNIHKTNKLTN